LWAWLRALGSSARAALFAAAVMSVSFKVAEILRFPNAVHAAAWYPWMLLACTRMVQAPSTRAKALAALGLGAATACLLTAGYPYYAYYAALLLPPYVAVLFSARAREAFAIAPTHRPLASFLFLFAATGTGVAICAPYLSHMSAMLGRTADRGGGNWQYATAHAFTPLDSLGALVYPPAAQAEGWYFFSLASVWVIAASLGWRRPRAMGATLLLGWIAVVVSITYGARSPLFAVLWGHVPGFSRLRVWARLNIVLLPVIAWFLAHAYSRLEEILSTPRRSPERRRAVCAVLVAYALAGGAQ